MGSIMRLKNVRLAKGMSQSELAEKSGLNLRTIQSYEQGAKSIDGAKLESLADLALALDCNIVDILESDELIEKCHKAGIW